jgi:hypothetical protein
MKRNNQFIEALQRQKVIFQDAQITEATNGSETICQLKWLLVLWVMVKVFFSGKIHGTTDC